MSAPSVSRVRVLRLSGRRLLLVLLAVLGLAIIPAVVLPSSVWRQKPPAFDDLGTVPGFAFVDDTGAPITAEAMRGHVTIVGFIFTRCETVCPVSAMKLQQLQEQTANLGDRVKIVAFSVDPDYDTPERLAAYARRFKADTTRWRFATGAVEEMRQLVEGPFMTSMLRVGTTVSGMPDIAHNVHFFLVDGELRIRGAYDSAEATRLDALQRHARYLANRLPARTAQAAQ